MKNILSILLVFVAFAAKGQIQDYVIEASDSLITRGVLQINADKFKATTQVSSDDTTLVSLDYLTNLLDAAEYADSLAFHSGTGYLVYYRGGVALDSTSLDGRYQTTLTNPVTGTGTTNYLPKFTGLSTLGNSLIYDNGTNVAIGGNSPLKKLHVKTSSAGDVAVFESTSENYGGIAISASSPLASTSRNWGIYANAYDYGALTFAPSIDNATLPYVTQYKLMLRSNGYLGIGGIVPQNTLDVNGNIRVRGVGTNTTSTLLGLDSNGDLTTNVSITGGATWKGGWNASTNTPTLSDATGTNGWWYKVTVAGTQNLGSGSVSYSVGDDVIHNGSVWQKYSAMISEADPVFVASDVYNWTTTDSTNWTSAYNWGDHSAEGYLTAEVDGSITNELQNLSLGTVTTTTQLLNISSGTGVTLPAATTTTAGLMSAADKTALSGISTNYVPYTGATTLVNLNARDLVNVGYTAIGRSVADKQLHVSTSVPGEVALFENTSSNYGGIGIITANTSNVDSRSWGIYSDANKWGSLTFSTSVDNNSTPLVTLYKMMLTKDGSLGIGGIDPTTSLDVNGNARFRSIGTGTLSSLLGVTSDGTLTTNVSGLTGNWTTAYNDKINSAAFSGTTTKTLTLTQQDAGTVTASFTDDNTTYTGSAGVQLVGNDFRMNIGSLNAGAISASTHYIPWYQSTGAHWRTTLAELQAVAGYNAGKIHGYALSATAPTTDYVWKFNGTIWAPAPDATGSSLTSGDAISVVGDSINYKPTRITATMTDLNMLNNAASIYTNFEYGGAIYRTTLGQLSDLGLYNARELRGYTIASATPSTGEVLKWTGSQWEPEPDNTGGMTDPMTTRGDIIYRNSSNVTARLGRGTAGQLLYSNGTDLSWRTPVKADIGLGNVENTALSTWTGSTNIGTVGSITTGTWSATPISAVKGGTGKTSYTPYALLAGGTTSSGTLQQVSNTGDVGDVLTYNGAGALPTWEPAPSGGSGGWLDEGNYVRLNTFADRVTIGGGSDPNPFKLEVVGDGKFDNIQTGYITSLSGIRLGSYTPGQYATMGTNTLKHLQYVTPTTDIYILTPQVRINALNASSMRYYDGRNITDTLTVNTIYYITHVPQGGDGEILVKQDGTGGRTLTLYFYDKGQTGEPDSSTELTKVTVGATNAIKTTANKHTLIRYRRWGTKVTLEYLQEP